MPPATIDRSEVDPSSQAAPRASGEVKLEDLITDEVPFTLGYKPTLPYFSFYGTDGLPQLYAMRDIEVMAMHPHASMAMAYFKAGVFGAEFEYKTENQEVLDFITAQVERFWSVGVKKIQGGYDYGWIGCESMYREDNGLVRWDHFIDFSPRDTFLLTKNKEYAGVRVKNIVGRGKVDLWPEREDVPAKAFWYAHRPRFNQYYGMSQYASAWRPWKRLATEDAAEFVVDMAIYRFGVAGPVFKYPPSAFKAGANSPIGIPWQDGRSMARQFCEQAKAGASIALPSTTYSKDQGGGPMWELQWPDHVINVAGLLEYIKYLCDQISFGIGTPPELLQASETGSGFSGRAIPLEAFLMMQQQIADAMLEAFVRQVLRPLVFFNFGPVKFEAKVKSLLKTRQERCQPQQGGMQPGQAGAQPGQPGAMPGQQDAAVGPMPGGQAPQPQGGSHHEREGTAYVGKRGGHGWIDPKGKVHYGEFSLEELNKQIVTLAKMPPKERQAAQHEGLRLLGMTLGGEQAGLENYLRVRKELVGLLKVRKVAA